MNLFRFAKSIITDEKHVFRIITKKSKKKMKNLFPILLHHSPFPLLITSISFFFISSFIYLFIVLFFIHLHFPLFIDLFTTGCGSLVNNSLISPGYPYPDSVQMECVYSVPIPSGKAMKIYFEDFDVGYHRWYGCK